jgi:hypothetical protein
MGASSWDYFVPYQQSIESALNELREQVFRSGKFFLRPQIEINPDNFADAPEEIREQIPAWIEREKSFSQPTTLKALVDWNGEEGTHSIIDVERITPIPTLGSASPFSTNQLIEIFGTDKPERNIIEQRKSEITGMRKRWEASYIVVYKDGKPDEIFFSGYSGD